jgi:glutamine amidotransferase
VTKKRVVVLDYGSGNVHSAVKALIAAGAEVELTADRTKVLEADGLVVPGVGAFAAVMQSLNAIGAAELIDKRLTGGKKVLGICVGLQVLFDRGVEHGINCEGLGQLPGVVEELDSPKLPHIGWNTVDAAPGSILFEGVENDRFYFVHSYGVQNWKLEAMGAFIPPKVSWSEYGSRFVAACEVGPLAATQFHPEKSGEAGIRLLTNWVNSL